MVISPNTAFVTFWLNCGARRPKEKRFRSREDEDDALKCVRELNPFVCGLNGGPLGFTLNSLASTIKGEGAGPAPLTLISRNPNLCFRVRREKWRS